MTEAAIDISHILKDLLEHSGLSEAALGREINVPRATINRLVSGRTPDPRASTLTAIAKYFGVSIGQLLGNQPLTADYRMIASDTLAGIPLIAWDELKSSERIDGAATDKVSKVKFALKVQGEAMWPQFQEDSILIVDSEKSAKNRDFVIVAIKSSNEILFRQLFIDGNHKILKAVNPIFPLIEMSANDHIVGVIVQTTKHFD